MVSALDRHPRADPARTARFESPRGLWRGLAALRRRLRQLTSWLRWRPRFGAFGWGSLLQRPDQLSRPGLIHIGRGVEIRRGARLEALAVEGGASPRIEIGDGTSIQLRFHCGAAGRIAIGRNVLIAGGVYVTDHDHDLGRPGAPAVRSDEVRVAPTRIDDDCWLGEGAMVLKGVHLGRGTVVAAGAVVTRSTAPYTLVAGVPARVLRRWDAGRDAWVEV